MGATLSASSAPSSEPIPPLPPPTAAPPPTASPASSDSDTLSNPGDYEEIGRVKEQLFPLPIEGAKIIIQKGLSRHLQTTHTLVMGSTQSPASQWQYGATYVGTKKIADNEFRPVLIGDISTSGNFTALILHQMGPWRMKINAQTQKSQWVGYQGTFDYVGKDFTASATVANPDVFAGSGVLVAQYLQALTSRLALGSELVYQRSGGMQGTMLSLGGYYKTPLWEASAKLGIHSWSMNYHQKLDTKFTMMASLEGNLMQSETSAAIGYKLDVGGLTMKGKVSSHGAVSASLEKTLTPLPAQLLLSGKINHWTDETKFGIGIVVG